MRSLGVISFKHVTGPGDLISLRARSFSAVVTSEILSRYKLLPQSFMPTKASCKLDCPAKELKSINSLLHCVLLEGKNSLVVDGLVERDAPALLYNTVP